ncbi:Fic family protein [Pedobacter sp. UYP30]|uniref:Fic family protein n=1 Tax=Pedobacter sp. UYP30 TaxID=1756400 RepID=UPI003398B836
MAEIKRKSEELNALKPLKPAHKAILDKKFRLEFNFNSNHLEGNTLTYGETELLLIFDQTEGTHDYREYQEMQAHDVALKMIQEEALDKERPLTEQFIRNLNEKLLVKPFWKDAITPDGQATRKEIIPGAYKKTPNSVRLANGEIFNYTVPEDVQKEISELVMWYNEKAETEDPILLASILHYRFVRIHPFDDGNGRTARLLMNYVLSKNSLPLVIIKSAEKKDYLFALNKADTGDLNAFVEYIGKQLLWSLDISIRAAKGENIDEEEDLDKELELLKQDLKQIPNEGKQEKTYANISEILKNSIYPLFRELNSKFEKIKDFFFQFESNLKIKYLTTNALDKEASFNNIELLFTDFDDYQIKFATLNFKCTGLKKIVNEKNIEYKLTVEFDKFSYRLTDNTINEDLIGLPYGRALSKANIKEIVKAVMKNIIEEIKSATNLNN